MKFQIPFIGREAETDLIDRLVKDTGTQVLCLCGPGGIGKTSLLRDVYSRYTTKPISMLSVGEIIDFDDHAAQYIDGIRRQLIRGINKNEFNSYFTELDVLRKMEIAEVGREALERQRSKVNNDFIESYNRWYADQRVILLFDTAEMIRHLNLDSDIISLVTGLKNCLSIIAGRNLNGVWKMIQSKLGNNAIYHEIPPLYEDDELFNSIQQLFRIHLAPILKQEILLLAGGRPIWIYLAVEWITQLAITPRRLNDRYSLAELESLPENELKRMQEDFGQQMVQNITNIRSHKHQLLLIMSRIYPINANMIAEMIDGENPQEIFDEAIAYPYIKSPRPQYISLHDDMREMINKYVWPRIDPLGERRQRDSRWVIDYILRQTHVLRAKINTLNDTFAEEIERADSRSSPDLVTQIVDTEQDLWALEFQRLEHACFVDIKIGKKVFIELFDEATSTYRMLIREKLIERARSMILDIPIEERFEIDTRIVQALLYAAKFNEAQDILINQLSHVGLSDTQRVSCFILLGRARSGLGRMHESINDFSEAHSIASHLSIEDQANSSRWLGQGYLNLGQYEAAVKHLKTARDLSEGLPLSVEQGWILNDLAYVYSRLEYLDLKNASLSTAKEAEELWHVLKNDRGRGALYVVYMSIYKRQEDFDKSLDYGDRAWEIFEPQNDLEWLCRISYERGVAFLEKGEYQKARCHIEKAKDFGIKLYLPEIYYWLAQTYISSGDKQLAYDCSMEGSELAGFSNPQYYLYLLSQQARLANMLGYFEQQKEIEVDYRDYKDTYPEIQQLAAESLLHYFLGTLALQACHVLHKEDIADSAIEHLKEAIPGIAQHIVYGEFQMANVVAKLNILLQDAQNPEWKNLWRKLGKELIEIWLNKSISKYEPDITLAKRYPEALGVFEQWQSLS